MCWTYPAHSARTDGINGHVMDPSKREEEDRLTNENLEKHVPFKKIEECRSCVDWRTTCRQ